MKRWVYSLAVSLMVVLVVLPRACKHAPMFCGQREHDIPWVSDARYHEKGSRLLGSFRVDHSEAHHRGGIGNRNTPLSLGISASKVYRGIRWHGIFFRRPPRARATKVYCTGVLRRVKSGAPSSRGTALKRLGPNRTSLHA